MGSSSYTGASGRFVPDVAFSASADHDGYLVCSQNVPRRRRAPNAQPGFVSSTGYIGPLTCTAARRRPTPSFAGMLTLLVQKYGNGKGLGNINPTLYGLAANSYDYTTSFTTSRAGTMSSLWHNTGYAGSASNQLVGTGYSAHDRLRPGDGAGLD